MRISFFSPPSLEELRESQIHELVRDFPELLEPLEALGIEAGEAGGVNMSDLSLREEEWRTPFRSFLHWRGRSE
jgi:hypothetical protein